MDEKQSAPAIIGLTTGIGFIVLLGSAISFPVYFSVSETAMGGFPEDFQVVRMTQQDFESKYPVLKDGQDFIYRQKLAGVIEPIPFGTTIPLLQANVMKNELPFVEQSHPDENSRTYYLVIEVPSEEPDAETTDTKLYLVGLRYLRLF